MFWTRLQQMARAAKGATFSQLRSLTFCRPGPDPMSDFALRIFMVELQIGCAAAFGTSSVGEPLLSSLVDPVTLVLSLGVTFIWHALVCTIKDRTASTPPGSQTLSCQIKSLRCARYTSGALGFLVLLTSLPVDTPDRIKVESGNRIMLPAFELVPRRIQIEMGTLFPRVFTGHSQPPARDVPFPACTAVDAGSSTSGT